MNLSQIFAKLNTLNAEVSIFRDKSSWRNENERWGCVLTISSDGTELKVKTTAGSGDEALFAASDKLDFLLSSSAVTSAFDIPLLSASDA